MSSPTLTSIQKALSLYGNSIFLIVGNIGNAFIITLFSRQGQTACSIYLLSSAVVNFVFLTINGYFQIFPFNYSDGTIRAINFCKISAYILNVLGQVSKTMLIFACIDRFLITSDRASFRAFSIPKRAKYLIFFSFIFWSILALHVPIMRTVTHGQCGASGIYSTIFAILFVSLIPFIILAIFGYLTYRNMRQMQMRVQPIIQNTIDGNISIQRRDRDLLIIVIAEVVTYVVTTALYPLILLETIISQNVISNKSAQYSQIESFILNIAYLLLFFNSATPFYTYFISSKSFRRNVKQLIINTYRKITRQTLVETVSRTNRT
jgi:hypothetical protein